MTLVWGQLCLRGLGNTLVMDISEMSDGKHTNGVNLIVKVYISAWYKAVATLRNFITMSDARFNVVFLKTVIWHSSNKKYWSNIVYDGVLNVPRLLN